MLHEAGWLGLAGGVAGLAGLLGDGVARRRGPRGLGRGRGDLPQHRGVAVHSHLEESNYRA